MTEGEIIGFGTFIISNLVGISWFARGVQKDMEEVKAELKETREELKTHKTNGSDLSKELRYRVENLEEWKQSTNGIIDRLRARSHDLINMVAGICAKLEIPFNRRENW